MINIILVITRKTLRECMPPPGRHLELCGKSYVNVDITSHSSMSAGVLSIVNTSQTAAELLRFEDYQYSSFYREL